MRRTTQYANTGSAIRTGCFFALLWVSACGGPMADQSHDARQRRSHLDGSAYQVIPVNQDIQSILFNAINRKVYTANRDNNTATIIDVDLLQVTRIVPTVLQPIGLGYSSSGATYVGGYTYPATLTRIDSRTDTPSPLSISSQFPTWTRNYSFAADSTHDRIWYANAIGPVGDIVVINDATGASTRIIPRNPDDFSMIQIPYMIAYSEQHNRAYAIGTSGQDPNRYAWLSVFDGTTLQQLAFKRLSDVYEAGMKTALFYNPINDKLYCSLTALAGLVIVDGDSLDILANLPVTPLTFALNPKRDVVYGAAFSENVVLAIDGVSNQVVSVIRNVYSPYGIDFNTLTGNLYVLSTGEDQMVVFDGTTDAELRRYPAGPFPTSFINQDGAMVAADNTAGLTFWANITRSGQSSVGVTSE